jgi:hypothetical protein
VLEGKTIVYEGLPHPNFDPPGLLESEKSSKQTTVLHDCYFYKSFQPAKDTETNELRELLTDPLAFSPFSGEKKCGGFHADYAVAWKENGQVTEVLICFGCGEVKRFGPRGTAREDMNADTEKLLQTILKMYDRDRPHRKSLGP